MDTLTRTFQPTRRVLGDVDPAQPLDTTHPLLDGVQGFWLPLPRLTGGSQLYDLSPYKRHFTLNSQDISWKGASNAQYPILGISTDGSGAGDASAPELSYPFTVSVAFRSNDDQGAFFGNIRRDNFDSWYIGLINKTSPGQVIIYADQDWIYSNKSFNDGRLHWATGIFSEPNPNSFQLYIDGKNVSSNVGNNNTTNNFNTNPDLSIGVRNTGKIESQWVYSGDIGNILVQDSALATSASTLYHQWRRGFPDLLNRRDSVGLLGGGGPSPISGTAAITDAQEQISATGETKVSGTLSVTDESETLTVDGAVITTGTAQITDAGEIISAVSTLQDITGSAQITDAAEEVSATGEVKIAGTATLSDGTEEIVIIGENDISGAVSFADLAAQIAAEGAVEVQGSLALTDLGESISARERVPARLATVDVRLEDIIIVHAKLTD